jgi:hypothetical protein
VGGPAPPRVYTKSLYRKLGVVTRVLQNGLPNVRYDREDTQTSTPIPWAEDRSAG